MKNELTTKQRLFCKHYVINGYNATKAAIAAGYSEQYADKMGWRLTIDPRIKAYIDKRLKAVEKKLDITLEKKIEKLWKIVEAAEPEAGEKLHASLLISAIAELNKMQGHHAPQKTESKIDDEQFKQLLKECERDY